MNNRKSSRVSALDGLRGVAVLMVVIFHYFGRWEDLYPYGDMFVNWPVASSGLAGVYLFFMISGFVIFRSLEGSRSVLHFIAKRADRLVLPMIVISTITLILLAGPLATEQFAVSPLDLLPSWTFTPPKFWRGLDPDIGYIDGAYWTLFYEVRFYALACLLWFFAPKSKSVFLLACIAVVSMGLWRISIKMGLDAAATVLDLMLFPQYLSLFALGAIYSKFHNEPWVNSNWYGVGVLFLSAAVGVGLGKPAPIALQNFLWLVAFNAVFLSLVFNFSWVKVFSTPWLCAVGAFSYSFYLLHQSLGVAMISRNSPSVPIAAQIFLVVIIAGAIASCAYLSFRYLEQRRPFSQLFKSRVVSAT